jgi:predicted ATP-dependent endonuclease of OLD family
MKKNTLLTLDSDLVELAKTKGINISGLVDNVLKNMLLNKNDPVDILKSLEEMNNVKYLGVSVKNIKISNIGPIKNFNAEFSEGINVIVGPNASGKTLIHKCISHLLNYENYPSIFNENSKVNLELNESEIFFEGNNSINVKSILIDDISRFDNNKIQLVLNHLNKVYNNPQIIINLCEEPAFEYDIMINILNNEKCGIKNKDVINEIKDLYYYPANLEKDIELINKKIEEIHNIKDKSTNDSEKLKLLERELEQKKHMCVEIMNKIEIKKLMENSKKVKK